MVDNVELVEMEDCKGMVGTEETSRSILQRENEGNKLLDREGGAVLKDKGEVNKEREMIKDDKNVVKCMVLINGKEETHLAKYEGRKDLPGMHGSYRSQSSGDCPPRCQDENSKDKDRNEDINDLNDINAESCINSEVISSRLSDAELKRQYLEKLRQWTTEKEELRRRREQILASKIQKKQLQEKQFKQQEEERLASNRKAHQKEIEKRLEELKEYKLKREELLLKSKVEGTRVKHGHGRGHPPKYVKISEEFTERERKMEEERKNELKKRREEMSINPEELKAHEQAYIGRIKERLGLKLAMVKEKEKGVVKGIDERGEGSEGKKGDRRKREEFTLLKRSEELRQRETEKLRRIKQFESKLKLQPPTIDHTKRREIELLIDKSTNPQKYTILSNKSLSDSQIFESFKHFAINIDRNKLGNEYFQEVREENSYNGSSMHRKTKSVRPVESEETSQAECDRKVVNGKKEYKNYIYDHPRSSAVTEAVVKSYRTAEEKVEARRRLLRKSELYEDNTLRKIKELKGIITYEESLKKEAEIDETFINSIKTKLQLVGMEEYKDHTELNEAVPLTK